MGPEVGINLDHPIYRGGTDPHRIEGGLPSFGSAPQNAAGGPGPQRPAGVDGTTISSGPASGGQMKKALPPDAAQKLSTERIQRFNGPLSGQPGPVSDSLYSAGYDTAAPPAGVTNGPDFSHMADGVGNTLKSIGNFFNDTTTVDNRSDSARAADSADSAALANAQKYGGYPQTTNRR